MRNKTILLLLLFAACNALALDMGDPLRFQHASDSICNAGTLIIHNSKLE